MKNYWIWRMIKELQIKMDKIYQDENNNFQFDFRNAKEVIVLDNLTHCIPELQYNVDFILVDKEIVFLEFKDSKVASPDGEEKFQRKLDQDSDRFCKNMAKKFVSSLFWLWACKKNDGDRKIVYYLLIESSFFDAGLRKRFRNKISRQLPHGYKKDGRVKREILSEFKVVSLEEWKKEFPQYIIRDCK